MKSFYFFFLSAFLAITCVSHSWAVAPPLFSLHVKSESKCEKVKSVASLRREVIQPSVLVRQGEHAPASGSGTVITWRGKVYVLTARHVVEESLAVKTRYEGPDGEVVTPGKAYPLEVYIYDRAPDEEVITWRPTDIVWSCKEHDLCLLQPRNSVGLVSARLRCSQGLPEAGEEAWYCGTGGGLPWSLIKTIVNQRNCRGLFVVNGEGWYGHSGSGVFLQRGGHHVLSGVVVQRHSVDNPRCPILCVKHVDIVRFLQDYSTYLANKEKDTPK